MLGACCRSLPAAEGASETRRQRLGELPSNTASRRRALNWSNLRGVAGQAGPVEHMDHEARVTDLNREKASSSYMSPVMPPPSICNPLPRAAATASQCNSLARGSATSHLTEQCPAQAQPPPAPPRLDPSLNLQCDNGRHVQEGDQNQAHRAMSCSSAASSSTSSRLRRCRRCAAGEDGTADNVVAPTRAWPCWACAAGCSSCPPESGQCPVVSSLRAGRLAWCRDGLLGVPEKSCRSRSAVAGEGRL